jgi:heat-inducible transcriptional repressor
LEAPGKTPASGDSPERIMALNNRAELLLKTLIERYIADGQPVGSRILARQTGLDLSPATVRNVMADLEELGLIRSPHTSAGRVPTELGYRVFVDSLVRVRPLQSTEVRRLEGELCASQNPQELIECASQMLSEVCHLTGIVTAPRRDDLVGFRQIDFVSLSGRRLLVILVTEDGQVQNRIVTTAEDFSPAELARAANYFNDTFTGVSLAEVKRRLVADMQRESDDLQRVMTLAMRAAHAALDDDKPGSESSVVVSGESNLMDLPDLGDVKKLRRLFDAFNTKRDLLHLLDRSLEAGGIKIFIGHESGYEAFEECSLVTAPYTVDGAVVGTLGVVGPTRMAYERIIPVVDITARLLSSALTTIERGGRLESPIG